MMATVAGSVDLVKQADLNPRSPVELWRQLASLLREAIDNGTLPVNEPIPAQSELVATYEIARGTAARAVTSLIAQGYVFTVKGKGAFVSPPEDRERHRQEYAAKRSKPTSSD